MVLRTACNYKEIARTDAVHVHITQSNKGWEKGIRLAIVHVMSTVVIVQAIERNGINNIVIVIL